MKKLDMIKASKLSILVRVLNDNKVQKDDLVGIYPPTLKGEDYTAVFYCE